MSLELSGMTALVTGASRGIGRSIALVLAEKGADIFVNYLNNEKEASKACEEITALGRKAIPVRADVSNEKDVRDMFLKIQETGKNLDILVNNAGTTKSQDIFETSLEDWEHVMKTNLRACFLCSKAAMEMMRERKSGRIVNISSIVGHRGALYGHVHYAATKSGIFGFTKTLALTGAKYGITVNAVAPGIIETELLFKTHGKEEVKKLSAAVPLGLGKVRDVGLGVAYLCGEGGRYITGATIDINGGMSLR